MSSFASRLLEQRKAKKLTQLELGLRFGLKQHTISQYERGDREPEIDLAKKFADYFGVTLSYMMGYDDDFETSFNSLKRYRNLTAHGKVIDIPEDKIPEVLKHIDDAIKRIEDDPDDDSKPPKS